MTSGPVVKKARRGASCNSALHVRFIAHGGASYREPESTCHPCNPRDRRFILSSPKDLCAPLRPAVIHAEKKHAEAQRLTTYSPSFRDRSL